MAQMCDIRLRPIPTQIYAALIYVTNCRIGWLAGWQRRRRRKQHRIFTLSSSQQPKIGADPKQRGGGGEIESLNRIIHRLVKTKVIAKTKEAAAKRGAREALPIAWLLIGLAFLRGDDKSAKIQLPIQMHFFLQFKFPILNHYHNPDFCFQIACTLSPNILDIR
jgi:hypothetical protein